MRSEQVISHVSAIPRPLTDDRAAAAGTRYLSRIPGARRLPLPGEVPDGTRRHFLLCGVSGPVSFP